ncbi:MULTISPECIES: acetoacetate decarboxylase family protein [unclassified Pseudomonas]|uniref:acetoacetate decarboxylase family protein n=2 Tax=Pseudomonas TaxID=286 RepID=UPI0005B7A08C|nr:acetoacetate decarboxylase family protein [Pseudomonas sp. EGD-AKN5]KSW21967.1 acetoacetate decarboxylase (ADC) [Pseudomonas sp. ADP]MBB1607015.1 acetoacetate decarboxylase (ADC) [Pseudomonas sp. UMC76]MBB1637909.1 acetoacetate decarboxylase (ADC) [Pseudomonas sp. UME83]OBP10586.1 acetoacetate decarboxylase (ADC) [Pseudomonas sp. EGD-AKN5]
MKLGSVAAIAGLFVNALAASAWAEVPATESTMIDIAGHEVPVVKGGLYDRYRSNPPLSVIAAEAPDVDLSWFKGLAKTKVDIGFESYSPNFYYKNSRVTAVYTADIDKLRELIPAKVLEKVQPLQVWPGRGLVAFTAYSYHYCDNDSYNEVALSIITNKPGRSNLGPLTLVGQSLSKDYWGYVLKLPVNTELARVRGVVGYNLPKWLTGIDVTEDAHKVTYDIVDSRTGKVDVVFQAAKLAELSQKDELVTNSFTNTDRNGELTYGYAVSRQLSHASSSDGDSARLILGDGELSSYIKSLKLGKMLKYEYVPQFQSALYAPKPLGALVGKD